MSRFGDLEALATTVVDCGFRLHAGIGPDLLENAYEALMAEALRQRGLEAARQVAVPLQYNGVVVDNAFKDGLRRIANDYYGSAG
jgi:iron complex transport system substrate-binding protein